MIYRKMFSRLAACLAPLWAFDLANQLQQQERAKEPDPDESFGPSNILVTRLPTVKWLRFVAKASCRDYARVVVYPAGPTEGRSRGAYLSLPSHRATEPDRAIIVDRAKPNPSRRERNPLPI